MDWPVVLPENKKSTGLVSNLFIILMAVVNSTRQNQAGSVIYF